MAKLQLYITKSLRGFKSLVNLNPDEEVRRHIHDLRPALEVLDYDLTEKNIFYLVSYLPEGTMLTVLRTIPDGPQDHLAATIFVPANLDITPARMLEVVRLTTRKVSNPGVSAEDLNLLRETFASDYGLRADSGAMVASQGTEYAMYAYNGETGHRLADFMGAAIYQTPWLGYAGVLLVDADLPVTGRATDLTGTPLPPPVVLEPPMASEEGFSAHIFHHLFDRPYLVTPDTDVEISWRRQGFENVNETVHVGNDSIVPVAETAEAVKVITPASFYVTSQSTQESVSDPVITVNGIEITDRHPFRTADLVSARVHISAPGFAPFSGNFDLAATTQALVQLHELRKVYIFELPTASADMGAPIRLEMHSKKPITASPVEGYSLAGGEVQEGVSYCNRLVYTGTRSRGGVLYAIVTGILALIVGMVLGGLIFARDSKDTPVSAEEAVPAVVDEVTQPEPEAIEAAEPVEEVRSADVAEATGTPEAAEPPEKSEPTTAPAETRITSVDQAKAYLDTNAVWRREEMQKYAALDGLFDDMNTYNFKRIIDYWGPKFANSRNMRAVVAAAKGSATKRNPRKGEHNPNYTTGGDIRWRPYTFWIDP